MLGPLVICTTSKDNLDSQSGIPVNLWSSKVNLWILLHISISSSKFGNRDFRRIGIILEFFPSHGLKFGIGGQVYNITCLQNDLKWNDLRSLDI